MEMQKDDGQRQIAQVTDLAGIPKAKISHGEIQEFDVQGTKSKLYEDVKDFANALADSKPTRIFTKTSSMLFTAMYTAAFVDSEGMGHGFLLQNYEGVMEQIKPIYDVIDAESLNEVDGVIKQSPINGNVYFVFSPDSDTEESISKNYGQYITAIQELIETAGNPEARAALKDGQAMLNVRCGKHNYITGLSLEGERSLDSTIAKFSGLPISDESWVVEMQ